jgi:hypothetical protein
MMIGQNDFEKVSFTHIDLTATLSHETKRAFIEEIWPDAWEVAPGETLTLHIAVRPYRGEKKVYTKKILVPSNFPEGTLTLLAGHADAINKVEKQLFRGDFAYKDLTQFFKMINELRQNRYVHILMLRPEKSAVLKGKFFPSLPPSKFAVMQSTASRGDLNTYNIGIVDTLKVETDYVVSGYREIAVEVARDPGSP